MIPSEGGKADRIISRLARRPWAGGALMVFDIVELDERHVEAIDVENGVYEAFDSRGEPLGFDVERGVVEIYSVGRISTATETRLRRILQRALGRAGEVIDRPSLDTMVRRAKVQFRTE